MGVGEEEYDMRRSRLSMRDIEQELEQQGYPKHNDLFEFAAVLMAMPVFGITS
jgi:hypothetical protein